MSKNGEISNQGEVKPAVKTNMQIWADVLTNLPESYKKWFEEEKKYLQEIITPNSRVLEVGCGDGRSISDILPITSDVVGIDHDDKAVDDARNNFSSYPSVRILKAEATNLPFEDGEFDFVMCMTTFANFADKKFFILDEMKRVLKKDGKIIISVFSEDALEERMKVYKAIKAKVKKIKDGTVTLGSDQGDIISEQFSRKQLGSIFNKANLQVEDMTTIGIAHLCTLTPSFSEPTSLSPQRQK